jgi:hypothetical protein
LEIALTIAVVVAFTLILTWVSMRQKASAWAGNVTKIRKNTYMKNEIEQEEMLIYYRTDAGKKGKLKYNPTAYEKFFSDLEVGDRLIKDAGEYVPRMEKATG